MKEFIALPNKKGENADSGIVTKSEMLSEWNEEETAK